jgi:hypothetical protein
MSSPLIQIGDTRLFSGAPNSAYDASLNSALAASLESDLDAITAHKTLSCESLSIDHYIDGRATAGFTVFDSAGDLTFYERQQVLITDADMVKSFAGVIQEAAAHVIPGTVKKFIVIGAADFTAILDWRNVDYSALDTLVGDAVRAIMDEYLAEEGITEGYIEGGELLTEISIGNKTVGEAFTKLAEACPGFVCYLDYDRKLYFHNRTLYAADWNITDKTDFLKDSMEITHANDNYRNTEIVVGGYEETDLLTEPFVTDGVLKSFPLGYKVNRVSTITVNGSAVTFGQKGTDAGSYDAYYAVNSETITFDVAPAAGLGEIQYYGLWRSKSKAEDLSAIAANQARQGFGSGKIEHITIDESLTSIVGAGEYASAKLAEFGVDGITVTYKTMRPGLAAGTLQHIVVPEDDIDHDFLIAHVAEELLRGVTTYTVTGYYGPVGEEWTKFFLKSFSAIYTIREGIEEGTGVVKLYNFSHTFDAVDRPNPFTSSLPGVLVSEDSWPCFEPEDKALYIEFWRDGACCFRKQHTSVPDILEVDEFHSYSFISPADAIGEIDEIVWWSGDSATLVYGSGVEVYRANFSHSKSILESLQINMLYVNNT